MKKSALILGIILSILTISSVFALIDVNNLPQLDSSASPINASDLPVMNVTSPINASDLPLIGAGGAEIAPAASTGLPIYGWIGIIAILVILVVLIIIIITRVLKKPAQTKKEQ